MKMKEFLGERTTLKLIILFISITISSYIFAHWDELKNIIF
jgi:hypothetical protein